MKQKIFLKRQMDQKMSPNNILSWVIGIALSIICYLLVRLEVDNHYQLKTINDLSHNITILSTQNQRLATEKSLATQAMYDSDRRAAYYHGLVGDKIDKLAGDNMAKWTEAMRKVNESLHSITPKRYETIDYTEVNCD